MPTGGRSTLIQFLIEERRHHPEATGDLNGLIADVALACKAISRKVAFGALAGVLGDHGREAGHVNVQGEKQKTLDVLSNDIFLHANEWGGHVAAMASEEMDDIHLLPARYPRGKYLLAFDPLDGSSNIDANVNIGTIFSILPRISRKGHGTLEDCLQAGRRQLCAGYVLYGSSTMLVYTTGDGVHGFTYEPSIGEFLLSHNHIQTPQRGHIYSVNEGNYAQWSDGMKRYVDWLKVEDKDTERPYSGRYVGSLVADFHRNLLYGGIYMYPPDGKNPNGKLRLLYEGAPLAFVAEQAGGAASDGTRRIMDIAPSSLHQRTPLFIGSPDCVKDCESFLAGKHEGLTLERRS